MSLPAKGEGKLRQINKLVNQFASSIRHKPFNNDIDKARTLYEPLPIIPVTEEQREQSRIQISRVREHLKKGKD